MADFCRSRRAVTGQKRTFEDSGRFQPKAFTRLDLSTLYGPPGLRAKAISQRPSEAGP